MVLRLRALHAVAGLRRGVPLGVDPRRAEERAALAAVVDVVLKVEPPLGQYVRHGVDEEPADLGHEDLEWDGLEVLSPRVAHLVRCRDAA